MTGPRTADYLEHMVQAIDRALEYTATLDKTSFTTDIKTQQAVILNVVILGEAATKIMQTDEALVITNPQIPWRSIRGMRNRMAHGYFEVDIDIVWDTITLALPPLRDQLMELRKLRPQ